MLRTCSRFIALIAMVAAPSTTAHPADARLTLACKGMETRTGFAGTGSEQIDIEIIVDFEKKKVIGLSDSPDDIDGFDEMRIFFGSDPPDWIMNGTIDRVTGALVAASSKRDLGTGEEIRSFSYDLKCRPTEQEVLRSDKWRLARAASFPMSQLIRSCVHSSEPAPRPLGR